MKKILVLVLVLSVVSLSLLAQEVQVNVNVDEELEEAMQEFDEAMEELDKAMEEIPIISIERKSSDTPKMGVYLSDLDFQEVYEMHYPVCYGVYVSGVVAGGPSDEAGIIKGDIIMEFDDKKVKFENHLRKLIKSKNIDDEIEVVIFRSEEILSTKVILGTLHPRKEKDIVITKDGKTKIKYSVGYGGGSWIPVGFLPKDEFEDVNYILHEYGFNGLNEKGIFMNGGGGKGNVGKSWFIGGMGAGYSIDKKEGYITSGGNHVTRRMLFSAGFGGVTLDKRFAITKNIITSLGFMIGGGGYELNISQTDGSYDWNSLNNDMDNSANNAVTLSKSYVLLQPKVMVMYRLLSWLGIRAEAGYMLSHSITDGWNAKSSYDNYEIDNSPNTPFDGLTLTVGPWFGF